MMFDDDQKYAIEADGNVLISASAGSGKTAVLCERYLRLIKEGVPPERILVLTFSDKAALEMKERIGAKLSEYEEGLHPAEARSLAAEFLKANISTIHSFLSGVITKYFYEADIDPFFSVISDADGKALKAKAFETLQKRYNTADDSLYDRLVYSLSGSRSDNGLFSALEDYRELLTASTEDYDFDSSVKSCREYILGNMMRIWKKYERIGAELMEKCRGVKYEEIVEEILFSIKNVTTAIDEKTFISGVKTAERAAKRIVNSDCEETIERISAFKKNFNAMLKESKEDADELESLKEQAEEQRGIIEKFIEASRFYISTYSELKRNENKLDYSDLESYAIGLLEKDAVLKEVREQYCHILVDEYQDTNRVQEYILNRISRGNLFTVGDVKQSIFNFRLADPSIFLERKKAYDIGGKSRNLNNNYRTSERITDFINAVFSAVMTEEDGGTAYAEDSMLKSRTEYASEKAAPYSVAFFERIKENKRRDGLYGVIDDDVFEAHTAGDFEGLYIANAIVRLLDTEIYIPREEIYKKIDFDDIAVIVRGRGDNARRILSALKEAGIPVCADGFSEENAPSDLLIEVIKVVDNPKNDIPLAAVMLSYFGGFTDDDLKEIRLHDTDSKTFFDCIKKYIISFGAYSSGERQRELAERLTGFLNRMDRLREEAADGDIYSLMCEIVYGSGYDAYLGEARVSLEAFMESFRGAEYSLPYFLRDICGAKVSPKSGGSKGKVSFLTVHASKGLEFPVVFLADCNKGFNKEDERGPYVFDAELGIGFYNRDTDNLTQKNTLFRKAIILKKDKEQREEEARLLYVALTRAKNHLFISGSGKLKENETDLIYKTPKSFMDFIGFAALRDKRIKDGFVKDAEIEEYFLREANPKKLVDFEETVAMRLTEALDAGEKIEKRTVKQSATAVSRGNKLGRFEKDKRFDRGNAYHKVMQYVDFNDGEGEIKELIERFVRDGVFSDEDAKSVDINDIILCLNSDIMRYAAQNRHVREKEFMLYVSSKDMYVDGDDEKILVQGVIDLLILGKKNIIVDYKTGVLDETLSASYKKQLCIYKQAAENAGIHIDGAYLYSFDSGKEIMVF